MTALSLRCDVGNSSGAVQVRNLIQYNTKYSAFQYSSSTVHHQYKYSTSSSVVSRPYQHVCVCSRENDSVRGRE